MMKIFHSFKRIAGSRGMGCVRSRCDDRDACVSTGVDRSSVLLPKAQGRGVSTELLQVAKTLSITCNSGRSSATRRRGATTRRSRTLAIFGSATSTPLHPPRSPPSIPQRRRRRFIAPALGRPLNSSAAPDVRAPVVRGRWHFWGCFGPFSPSRAGLLPAAPWHHPMPAIYAGA